MNKTFDKAVFAALLQKAIGNRKQKDFAKEISMSKEHLSRLINQKFDNPPAIETLLRISRNTTAVSYQELLQAAGYAGEESSHAAYTLPCTDIADTKLIIATILAALPNLDVAWTVEKSPSVDGCDFSIQLNDCPLTHWHFHCMNNTTDTVIQNQLEANYLNLIFQELEPTAKYSFVTASSLEYETYQKRIPRNLSVNLSIILVDTALMKVTDEAQLQINGTLPEMVLQLCSF